MAIAADASGPSPSSPQRPTVEGSPGSSARTGTFHRTATVKPSSGTVSVVPLYEKISVNRMVANIDRLDQRARRAGWQDYSHCIKSHRWKRLRKLVLERDEYTCRHCGSNRDLTVHHRHYSSLGHEQLDDLQTLCRKCHDHLHDADRFAPFGSL